MNLSYHVLFLSLFLFLAIISIADCRTRNRKNKDTEPVDIDSTNGSPTPRTLSLVQSANQDPATIINNRLTHLSKLIKSNTRVQDQCDKSGYVLVTGMQYGNTTNLVVSFAHGLWLAKRRGLTLLVPTYMKEALAGYDMTLLQKFFCFKNQDDKPVEDSKVIMKISSEDLYLIINLFKKQETRSSLPALNKALINEVSRHFLDVFSALWSQPSKQVKDAALFLINSELGNTLNYTAVHKRSYHHQCAKIYADYRITGEDFDPQHIPMDYSGWKEEHALCAMKSKFITETQQLHHRENQKVYIASDHRETLSDTEYRSDKFFSINNLIADTFREILESKTKMMQVDMFLAIHSEFFVANPYSSYSLQVEIVRICLELFSTPTMNKDVYFTDKGRNKENVWVSKRSMKKMYSKLQPSLT